MSIILGNRVCFSSLIGKRIMPIFSLEVRNGCSKVNLNLNEDRKIRIFALY